jgi:hypothetical protein
MKELDFEKIYPWFLLRIEARSIVEKLLSEWNKLLNDASNDESVYHQFLAEHAGFFFSDGRYRIPVISKLRLGADYETDFVVMTDEKSYGFSYEFIEIETPHNALYTRSGDPRSRFTHSIQQVRNWKTWLEANWPEAKKLFPSKQFTIYDTPNFVFSVYIGRRSTSQDFLTLRNRLAADLDIRIHTFDYLTDCLQARPFPLYPSVVWQEWDRVDYHILNQLANPFFKAYSHKNWRKIVRSRSLSFAHMIANNAELLLKHRECNSLFEVFVSIWDGLPSDRRDTYIEDMKFLTYSRV